VFAGLATEGKRTVLERGVRGGPEKKEARIAEKGIAIGPEAERVQGNNS